jgi:hypothetical protein
MQVKIKTRRGISSLYSLIILLENLQFINKDELFHTSKEVILSLEPKYKDRLDSILKNSKLVNSYEFNEESLDKKTITIIKVEGKWWYLGKEININSPEEVTFISNWVNENEGCNDEFCSLDNKQVAFKADKEYFPPM